MRLSALFIISAMLLVFSSSAAFAQAPSTRGYDSDTQVLGEIGEVEETPEQESAPQQEAQPAAQPAQQAAAPVQASQSSLPFTGLEAGAIALLGAALIGTGFVMRRVASRTDLG